MTLYPESKTTPHRAIDMLELYGGERVWLNSACDWGISDPLTVPKTMLEMKRRGYDEDFVEKVAYHNPVAFMSQCEKFSV